MRSVTPADRSFRQDENSCSWLGPSASTDVNEGMQLCGICVRCDVRLVNCANSSSCKPLPHLAWLSGDVKVALSEAPLCVVLLQFLHFPTYVERYRGLWRDKGVVIIHSSSIVDISVEAERLGVTLSLGIEGVEALAVAGSLPLVVVRPPDDSLQALYARYQSVAAPYFSLLKSVIEGNTSGTQQELRFDQALVTGWTFEQAKVLIVELQRLLNEHFPLLEMACGIGCDLASAQRSILGGCQDGEGEHDGGDGAGGVEETKTTARSPLTTPQEVGAVDEEQRLSCTQREEDEDDVLYIGPSPPGSAGMAARLSGLGVEFRAATESEAFAAKDGRDEWEAHSGDEMVEVVVWTCSHCQLCLFSEADLRAHVQASHTVQPQPSPPPPVLSSPLRPQPPSAPRFMAPPPARSSPAPRQSRPMAQSAAPSVLGPSPPVSVSSAVPPRDIALQALRPRFVQVHRHKMSDVLRALTDPRDIEWYLRETGARRVKFKLWHRDPTNDSAASERSSQPSYLGGTEDDRRHGPHGVNEDDGPLIRNGHEYGGNTASATRSEQEEQQEKPCASDKHIAMHASKPPWSCWDDKDEPDELQLVAKRRRASHDA